MEPDEEGTHHAGKPGADLGLKQPRGRRADPQVAAQRHLQARPCRSAMHRSDDRLREAADSVVERAQAAHPGLHVSSIERTQHCPILPGAEGFSRAGQHRRAHLRKPRSLLQHPDHAEAHRLGQGVAATGIAERKGQHAVVERAKDGTRGIGHAALVHRPDAPWKAWRQ
jgi:hypothetical protein